MSQVDYDVYKEFLSVHSEQLSSSGVPVIFWRTLFDKLKKEEFDAGDHFMIQKVLVSSDSSDEESEHDEKDKEGETEQESCDPESEDYTWQVVVYSEDGVSPDDSRQIYLIDHAWTYKVDEARHSLVNVPGLLQRMANLFDLSMEGKPQAELVEEVFNTMWKYNQTYKVTIGLDTAEEKFPFWYVMDEFGSRIQHSDTPSVRMVPFYYVPEQCSYTLMWPIKQLQFEDEVTRDYVEFVRNDEEGRKLHLMPWQPYDSTDNTFEFGADYYKVKYEMRENLPNPDVHIDTQLNRKGKVYNENSLIAMFYEPNEFYELVDFKEDADIHWSRHIRPLLDFKSFSENHPEKFVNSFPCEGILMVKSVMYTAAMHYLLKRGDKPLWLQETYNLSGELKQFVTEYQNRKKRGDYNTWIIKPCYLGRSYDMQITDNLDCIIRLSKSQVKMACEYIDRPVLYNLEGVGLVKFDLRYMLLLHTVRPLKAFVHKTFSVRTANRPFSMTDFDDFEKHFTTMNTQGLSFFMIQPEQFVENFERQYPGHKWSDIEAKIIRYIRLLTEAVTEKEPPYGIAHSPQSRTLGGVDVMLKWTQDKSGKDTIQPVIFECNSDCNFHRQCLSRKEFFTDVYRTFFTSNVTGVPVIEL